MEETNIYILKLINDKYYIGFSADPKKRIKEHLDGNGSSFTKKYRPIKIIEIIHDIKVEKVDKYILKYMKKYGIDNVRGGSFKNEILNKDQLKILKNYGLILPSNEIELNTKLEINIPKTFHVGTCFRCMKDGHNEDECTEIKNKYGKIIDMNDSVNIQFKY